MLEREVGAKRVQVDVTRGEEALVKESELPLERTIGEAPAAQPPERMTLLRPQQSRNGVWRWQLRRRQRAG